MPHVAFSDADMWAMLGVVVNVEEGGECYLGPSPSLSWVRAEQAGWFWLKRLENRYQIEVTREGSKAVHRWAQRKTKEAIRELSR